MPCGAISNSLSVKELTVSAGENRVVTLPNNEVELKAFVVPTPPAGEGLTLLFGVFLQHRVLSTAPVTSYQRLWSGAHSFGGCKDQNLLKWIDLK